MGPLSHMWSVTYQNVGMRRMTVTDTKWGINWSSKCLLHELQASGFNHIICGIASEHFTCICCSYLSFQNGPRITFISFKSFLVIQKDWLGPPCITFILYFSQYWINENHSPLLSHDNEIHDIIQLFLSAKAWE